MHRFEVWAPAATRVEIEVGGRRVPMTAQPGGRHVAVVDDAGPGVAYAYSLDGGEPVPDPRSPSQPEGVFGPSVLVDHDAFPWTDTAWRGIHLPSAVVYELHVGTFTPEGTFEAVIEKLDHLVELGVTAVELLPVNEFSGTRGWGYDGVGLHAPHHHYGGPEGLKLLVDACHHRGLGVILDVVYNHLGPAGNFLGTFGPYFTDRYTTPWGDAVNLDGPGSDEVRAFIIDNAVMWLRDYHVDGLRIDAVHALLDLSAMHLLEEMAIAVEALSSRLGRPLSLIAESDLNDPRVVQRREVGGYGIDAQWSDDFHHALHAVLTGERSGYYCDFGSMAQLATALRQAFVYAGIHSEHRGRRHGRLDPRLPGYRFLGYLQNHDQVGNRAMGERSSMLMSRRRLQVAAALVLTAPFVPLLFQGEEWGASTPFLYFTDHDDPELGAAVSEGRRSEFSSFGWSPDEVPDPQDPATFRRSQLDWSTVDAELVDWHRRLIGLRRSVPGLLDYRLDTVEVDDDEAARWLVMRRPGVTVACNVGDAPVDLAAPGHVVLASDDVQAADGTVHLPPDSVAILVHG
jgi:maltooligosyltrehalose trehalohydrolase